MVKSINTKLSRAVMVAAPVSSVSSEAAVVVLVFVLVVGACVVVLVFVLVVVGVFVVGCCVLEVGVAEQQPHDVKFIVVQSIPFFVPVKFAKLE